MLNFSKNHRLFSSNFVLGFSKCIIKNPRAWWYQLYLETLKIPQTGQNSDLNWNKEYEMPLYILIGRNRVGKPFVSCISCRSDFFSTCVFTKLRRNSEMGLISLISLISWISWMSSELSSSTSSRPPASCWCIWFFKLVSFPNPRVQISHLYGHVPVWTYMWDFKSPGVGKDFEHRLHLCGFS